MKEKKGSKAKIIVPIIIVVLVIGGVVAYMNDFFGLISSGTTGDNANSSGMTVPVNSVADIAGIGGGISNQTKFSGVVEPQQTENINKDDSKKVANLLVETGDEVVAGQELFSYDVEDINLTLEQAKLEVDTITNTISTMNTQISDLDKERANADSSDKMSYTLQIQSLQLQIRTNEYDRGIKQSEVDRLQASLTNTSVVSPIDGIVKSVNSTGERDPMTGEEMPYISILSTGSYRVNGTISEFHINSLMPGQAVIIRSRVDQDATWTGVIDSIDRDNPLDNSGGNIYMNSYDNGGESSSKYSFFVSMPNYEGLMLGQHVFVELDFGTEEKREGVWIPSYFILNEEAKTYVWAKGADEKLEKRQITLGDYDEMTDTFEIIDGLTAEDYISFADPSFTEGMMTYEEQYMGGITPSIDAGMIMPEGEGGDMIMPEVEGGDMIIPEGEGAVIGGEDGDMAEGELNEQEQALFDAAGGVDVAEGEAEAVPAE